MTAIANYYVDYAVVTSSGLTLAIRHDRKQAENCFIWHTVPGPIGDRLRLIGISSNQSETILAVAA
jgi:hypothetical protein